MSFYALVGKAQLVEHHLMHSEVPGLIPGLGTCSSCRFDPQWRGARSSLSIFLFLCFHSSLCKINKSIFLKCPSPTPTGIKHATWVCTLIRNCTWHLLMYGMMLQPAKPHHLGPFRWIKIIIYFILQIMLMIL